MLLSVTLDSDEAKRILDLAWKGLRAEGEHDFPNVGAKSNKRLLESFRGECESAKGRESCDG